MMCRQKVLIVEDNPGMFAFLRKEVMGEVKDVRVLGAISVDEGEKLISENLDADVVVMDGRLLGGASTVLLVHKIREKLGFRGTMIGTSTDPDSRRLLVEAGCDCESPKGSLHTKLIEVLLAA